MKGHIFNLLEKFIVETAGELAYEQIYDRCEFKSNGIFIRSGNYPDADLYTIVGQTCEQLEMPIDEAMFAFGHWIFPSLLSIAPGETARYKHPKTLLMNLDDIHQIELKKIWPDAEPPSFQTEDTGSDTMTMTYDSPRELYPLVDGVLTSLSEYYGVKIDFQKTFNKKGSYQTCTYRLTFEG